MSWLALFPAGDSELGTFSLATFNRGKFEFSSFGLGSVGLMIDKNQVTGMLVGVVEAGCR
jgi:hypothetical protein